MLPVRNLCADGDLLLHHPDQWCSVPLYPHDESIKKDQLVVPAALVMADVWAVLPYQLDVHIISEIRFLFSLVRLLNLTVDVSTRPHVVQLFLLTPLNSLVHPLTKFRHRYLL